MHANADVARWLEHYWKKLRLPTEQAYHLAVTDDRAEFRRWTGRRLHSFALGCYCYFPLPSSRGRHIARAPLHGEPVAAQSIAPHFSPQLSPRMPTLWDSLFAQMGEADLELLPVAGLSHDYRHIIFVEPGMHPDAIEVTVAHELIHLADRVQGRPRRHHCHGHDAISRDEALLTGRDAEILLAQLDEETERRRQVLRQKRPYRYVFTCPHCGAEYPRVLRARRRISCGRCDKRFNSEFELVPRKLMPGEIYVEGAATSSLTATE